MNRTKRKREDHEGRCEKACSKRMAPSTKAQVEVGVCKIVKWNVRHGLPSDGFSLLYTIFPLHLVAGMGYLLRSLWILVLHVAQEWLLSSSDDLTGHYRFQYIFNQDRICGFLVFLQGASWLSVLCKVNNFDGLLLLFSDSTGINMRLVIISQADLIPLLLGFEEPVLHFKSPMLFIDNQSFSSYFIPSLIYYQNYYGIQPYR